MLLAFRVGNYRSFRGEQSFTMLRSSRMCGSQSAESSWDPTVSTVAGLYGANASGKSNFLEAMRFFQRSVVSSHQHWGPDAGVPRQCFLLDDGCRDLPSSFEVEFRWSGVRYQYGFEADDKKFLKEWLYAYPGKRRQTWFERDASSEGEPEWYFGKSLAGRNRVIADLSRPNSLFLSAAAANDHAKLTPVHHWVARHLRFAHPSQQDSMLNFTIKELGRQEALQEELRRLLRAADLGIHDFLITKQELNDEMRNKYLDVVKTLMALSVRPAGDSASDGSHSEKDDESTLTGEVAKEVVKIELEHLREDGSTVVLPFSSESLGTRAVVGLAGPIYHCLRTASTLIVDEIDTSLHPALVSHLIRIFQDRTTNPHQAQLVFASHDTSLLGTVLADEPVLARDQIWFFQKDRAGASQLYPLTEFQPRKLENIERGYLQGRYGAIPFLIHSPLYPTEDQGNSSADTRRSDRQNVGTRRTRVAQRPR